MHKDPLDLALGWCYRDFRYSDNPVRTKITYRNNTIEVVAEDLGLGAWERLGLESVGFFPRNRLWGVIGGRAYERLRLGWIQHLPGSKVAHTFMQIIQNQRAHIFPSPQRLAHFHSFFRRSGWIPSKGGASSQHPADDHDVHSFETYQLNPPVKNMHPLRPLEQEKIDKGETWKALDEEELKRIDEIRARVEKMQQDKLQNQTDELSDRFLSLVCAPLS
ncbi:hypothetical protein BC936DRAFT_138676 [Jimgerdemannia flammicorona]|uniref:Uncharacterized protein n=1 Tax=Jimgerdemannia flammicorona TaxID=994334 RepID=A0A433BTS3_9FUNG|nr:hypothetical protein BC936DRAFT_138676 [Jimgerdemannia flammicorona]